MKPYNLFLGRFLFLESLQCLFFIISESSWLNLTVVLDVFLRTRYAVGYTLRYAIGYTLS